MNVLALYHDLKRRGVRLEAEGVRLVVDAPAGELAEADRANLAELKPLLLKILSRRSTPTTTEDFRGNDRRFDARPSRHPGYTSLYDPVEGEWHDFPTRDCYPSIVELANKRRKKGAV